VSECEREMRAEEEGGSEGGREGEGARPELEQKSIYWRYSNEAHQLPIPSRRKRKL